MEMKVMDTLSRLVSNVGDDPVAFQLQFFGKLGDHSKYMAYGGGTALVYLGDRLDVLLGDHQKMDGGLGINVIKGVTKSVFIDFFGGNIPRDDLTKKAIAHGGGLLSFT
jgi:hypothetical protein